MIINKNDVVLEFDDKKRTPTIPIVYHEWVEDPKRFDVIIDSKGFIFFTGIEINKKIFMDSTGFRWTLNQIIENAPSLLIDVCIISASLNGLSKMIMMAIPELQDNDLLMVELMKIENEGHEYKWVGPKEKTGDPWKDLPELVRVKNNNE